MPSLSAWSRAPTHLPTWPASSPTRSGRRGPKDGRKIGVIVHHVATMYPLEIQLAQTLAGGSR